MRVDKVVTPRAAHSSETSFKAWIYQFATHEALNANHFDRMLRPHMRKRLLEFCDQYLDYPDLYTSPDADALWQRYAHVGLRDARDLSADVYLAAHCER